MTKTLLLFLLILGYFVANAQHNTLTQSQIKEDVYIFANALTEAHPGLDIYLNESQIDSLFAELHAFEEELELIELYTSLLQMISSIGDGHTDLYEGKLLRKTYPYLDHTLPFEFLIIHQHIFISENHSTETDIPLYSELLSVNGKTSKEILEIII